MEILGLVLPVIAIVMTGWLFSYLKIFPDSMSAALIQFAFYVAVPALLFLVLAQEPVSRLLNLTFLASFGGGLVLVFVAVFATVFYVVGRTFGNASMFALCSTQSNTGFIALPVVHAAIGTQGILPVAIATIFIVLIFLINIILIEVSQASGEDTKQSVLTSIWHAIINPVVLSTILGIAYAISGLGLPGVVTNYLQLLANAVTPCALFAIGMSIRFESLRNSAGGILIASCVKLIGLPLVVLALARLFELNPVFTVVAVICAAVPTAKNTFLLASKYDLSKQFVADTISISTVLSILTLVVWLFVLGHLYPGVFAAG